MKVQREMEGNAISAGCTYQIHRKGKFLLFSYILTYYYTDRQQHQCLVTPQYSRYTEYIEQLSGDRLAKFYEATEFSSDRQKVGQF